MYGGREALPDDHKFRGQRGRVRARYRRPQLGRGTEKIGETSQRKTNLQLASGAFSCKVAPFTPAGERTKKAPSRGGRTGSNGQQHPVVIDCEVLQKRRSRCTTPGELRATRTGSGSHEGWPTTHPQRALRHKSLVPPCFVNQLLDRFAWSVNDRSRSNVSSFDGRHAQEKGRRPSR